MVRAALVVAGLAAVVTPGALAENGDVFLGFTDIVADTSILGDGSVVDLATGDLNGDGIDDAVYLRADGTLGYIKGDPALILGDESLVATGDNQGRALELFDYNSDGRLDIVRVSNIDGGEARFFRNDGAPIFTFDFAVVGLGDISSFRDTKMGDFDGDDDQDIYVLTDVCLALIENLGGTFAGSPIISPITNFTARSLAVGDLNGDNRDDVIAGNTFEENLVILESDGNILFETRRFAAEFEDDIKLVDIDDDLDPDLLAVSTDLDLVRVYRNNGGTLDLAYSMSFPFPTEIEAGELNGDAAIDLVIKNDVLGSAPQRLSVLINDGEGFFDLQQQEFFLFTNNTFELANINPNSAADIIAGFSSGSTERVSGATNLTPTVAPGPFDLLLPTNGAEALALPLEVAGWGGTVRPAAEWARPSGIGVSFDIVISTSPTLGNAVFTGTFSGRLADLSNAALEAGTTYYWDVLAVNAAGQTTSANGPFSFTTAVGSSSCPDTNGDGEVDTADLLGLLSNFNMPCP